MNSYLNCHKHVNHLYACCLLIGLLAIPVPQARGQSIVTDGDVVADGTSLQDLKSAYCEHLVTFHPGVEIPAVCAARAKVVFVTSDASTAGGNIVQWANNLLTPEQPFEDGLVAADAICQYHAAIANPPLSGTFKAWLSTDTVSAFDRVGDNLWVLPDNSTVVANGTIDLLTCGPSCLNNPINVDQNSAALANHFTYTGTDALGLTDPFNCNNWTSGSSSSYTFGKTTESTSLWSSSGQTACTDNDRLYCFGT